MIIRKDRRTKAVQRKKETAATNYTQKLECGDESYARVPTIR